MRNRILGHKLIKAKDLVPHELNPRIHSQDQRDALAAIFEEVGFARSVLAYQLADGRYKLIDGHLRTSQFDPEDEIEVEILDVNDAEARKLLLTLDPLAALANYSDHQLLTLRDITKTDNATLQALWSTLQQDDAKVLKDTKAKPEAKLTHQWLIIIECSNEPEQTTRLAVCQSKGWPCKAVTS